MPHISVQSINIRHVPIISHHTTYLFIFDEYSTLNPFSCMWHTNALIHLQKQMFTHICTHRHLIENLNTSASFCHSLYTCVTMSKRRHGHADIPWRAANSGYLCIQRTFSRISNKGANNFCLFQKIAPSQVVELEFIIIWQAEKHFHFIGVRRHECLKT